MAIPNSGKATPLTGRSIQIPPLFSSPAPIVITARREFWLRSDKTAYDILANASKTSAWRSAATGLTEAERAVPSERKKTRSYLLVGFATKRLVSSDKNGEKSCEPTADTELGLVVVAWNFTWDTCSCETYLLLNMMGDGLCTPRKVDKQAVFYLPGFRFNHRPPKQADWQRWRREIENSPHATALWANNANSPSYKKLNFFLPYSLNRYESSESESNSGTGGRPAFAASVEESPDDVASLFGETSGEEEETEEHPVESNRGPSNHGNIQNPSQGGIGDVDTGSSAATQSSLTDQLSQFAALLETSEEIQPMDQTIRQHLARTRRKANDKDKDSAMQKFVDLGKKWEGIRDSHNFCVEIAGCCQLKKMPRLTDVTRIRHALVSSKANLGYDSLEKFFKITMVLLKNEQQKPLSQDAVNSVVRTALELMGV